MLWTALLVTGAVTCSSLKLTPVQQLTQKVDVINEAKTSSLILQQALKKIHGRAGSADVAVELLESAEVHRMYSLIRRWGLIEVKLRTALTLSSKLKLQAYDDMAHNVASSEVLIAHLLLEAGDSQAALGSLEKACPVLWRYKAAWRSLETEGWLDCFTTMNHLYSGEAQGAQRDRLAAQLLEVLPWLAEVVQVQGQVQGLSDAAQGDQGRGARALALLEALSASDREALGLALRVAWATADEMRVQLEAAVGDLVGASVRAQQAVLLRVQWACARALREAAEGAREAHGQGVESEEGVEAPFEALGTGVSDASGASVVSAGVAGATLRMPALRALLQAELAKESGTYLYLMRGLLGNEAANVPGGVVGAGTGAGTVGAVDFMQELYAQAGSAPHASEAPSSTGFRSEGAVARGVLASYERAQERLDRENREEMEEREHREHRESATNAARVYAQRESEMAANRNGAKGTTGTSSSRFSSSGSRGSASGAAGAGAEDADSKRSTGGKRRRASARAAKEAEAARSAGVAPVQGGYFASAISWLSWCVALLLGAVGVAALGGQLIRNARQGKTHKRDHYLRPANAATTTAAQASAAAVAVSAVGAGTGVEEMQVRSRAAAQLVWLNISVFAAEALLLCGLMLLRVKALGGSLGGSVQRELRRAGNTLGGGVVGTKEGDAGMEAGSELDCLVAELEGPRRAPSKAKVAKGKRDRVKSASAHAASVCASVSEFAEDGTEDGAEVAGKERLQLNMGLIAAGLHESGDITRPASPLKSDSTESGLTTGPTSMSITAAPTPLSMDMRSFSPENEEWAREHALELEQELLQLGLRPYDAQAEARVLQLLLNEETRRGGGDSAEVSDEGEWIPANAGTVRHRTAPPCHPRDTRGQDRRLSRQQQDRAAERAERDINRRERLGQPSQQGQGRGWVQGQQGQQVQQGQGQRQGQQGWGQQAYPQQGQAQGQGQQVSGQPRQAWGQRGVAPATCLPTASATTAPSAPRVGVRTESAWAGAGDSNKSVHSSDTAPLHSDHSPQREREREVKSTKGGEWDKRNRDKNDARRSGDKARGGRIGEDLLDTEHSSLSDSDASTLPPSCSDAPVHMSDVSMDIGIGEMGMEMEGGISESKQGFPGPDADVYSYGGMDAGTGADGGMGGMVADGGADAGEAGRQLMQYYAMMQHMHMQQMLAQGMNINIMGQNGGGMSGNMSGNAPMAGGMAGAGMAGGMGMVPMPMNWEMGNWNQPGMPMPIPMPMQGMGMGMQGIPMQTPMHIPIMTAAMPSVRGSPPTVGSPSQPYSPSRQSSPPPMSDSEAGSQEQIVAAVKTQIEYYFSAGNLQGDPYLRRQMDHQGFVPLLQLSRFRRLVQLGASPELILDAVRQSSELHVEEGAQGGGGPKVRCLNDPTRWVLNEDSLVGAQ